MNLIRKKCAICNSKLKKIYKLENVPITLACVENDNNYNFDTMSFSICVNCNTIQLDKLIELNILYGLSHNFTSVGKIWENYYDIFIKYIQNKINNKVILEIGDPSGKLATNCSHYNKWYIVEPNKNNNVAFNEKIIFIESFFDNNFKIDQHIDLIIHSHLFEHIYDFDIFLKKCYEILNENGEMIFGVPNMENIAKKSLSLFVGVFFEHTIFLDKENITYLLKKNGFNITKIVDYENHSIIFHTQKSIKNTINNIKIYNYYEIFINTINQYNLFVIKCNENIINNTSKNIYLFGASYNNQLLLAFGLNKNITGVLDNCKEKQNKYLYGSSLKIFDPEVLINDSIVILKNGYYVKEIYDQIISINKNTIIIQ